VEQKLAHLPEHPVGRVTVSGTLHWPRNATQPVPLTSSMADSCRCPLHGPCMRLSEGLTDVQIVHLGMFAHWHGIRRTVACMRTCSPPVGALRQ